MSTTAPRVAAPRPLVVGTVVWLTSEVLFFGTLFGTWFSLRSSGPGPWPPEGAEVEAVIPLVGTGILLASSATVQAAASLVGRGEPVTARRWLVTTLILGCLFLTLQGFEWTALDFEVDDHAYGTAFFALTGFHGLHVLGGLGALAVMVRRVRIIGSAAHESVEVVSIYWHFVDLVWLVLFVSVYVAG